MPYRGVQEAGSEEESERDSSLSIADLQAATSWECFRQATFLMILSREGPSTRPQLEGPPRDCGSCCIDGEVDIERYQSSFEHLLFAKICSLVAGGCWVGLGEGGDEEEADPPESCLQIPIWISPPHTP